VQSLSITTNYLTGLTINVYDVSCGMEWFSATHRYPLVIILFATSIVVVIGSPAAEPPTNDDRN
jgi:hypothetical protein